jgi:hypothetical protein
MGSSTGAPPPRFRPNSQGVITATGVEQLIAEYDSGGVVMLECDIDATLLLAGDNLRLRLYKKFPGGAWVLAYVDDYPGPLIEPMIETFGLIGAGIRMTMQQTAGVMRDFPFMSYVWT